MELNYCRATGQGLGIRIQSGQWIRIRNPDPDPGGQKVEKIKKFHILKCWMFF
jgi:hypothetical protein